MSIDLRKLRHVVEVARSEAITTAANTLHITQSALTRSIADVEAQLGVSLFHRLPRGVRLSDAGKRFVQKAKQILSDMDELVYQIDDYRELNSGRLRLAIAPTTYQSFITKAIASLANQYPGISIEISTGSAEDVVPKLLAGEVDLVLSSAIYLQKWPDLNIQPLRDFYSAVIVRKNHPLSRQSHISEAQVLSYPAIMPETVEPIHSTLAQRYSHNKLPPVRPRYVTDDFNLIQEIINNTDAFSTVLNLNPGFKRLRQKFMLIEGVVNMATQQLAIASARSNPDKPVMAPFIQELQLCLQE